MNWSSVLDFWAMGGYALYVWGAYLVVLVWMLLEPLQVRRAHRNALRHLSECLE